MRRFLLPVLVCSVTVSASFVGVIAQHVVAAAPDMLSWSGSISTARAFEQNVPNTSIKVTESSSGALSGVRVAAAMEHPDGSVDYHLTADAVSGSYSELQESPTTCFGLPAIARTTYTSSFSGSVSSKGWGSAGWPIGGTPGPGAGGAVVATLTVTSGGQVYFHPYYVVIPDASARSTACDDVVDGTQTVDALSYSPGISPAGVVLVPDLDPSPDVIVVSATFGRPPVADGQAPGGLTSYSYQVNLVLQRTPRTPQWLVGMGDSYASGEGAYEYSGETDVENVNHCHQSGAAYPFEASRTLFGTPFEFDRTEMLSCSGAKAENIRPLSAGGRRFCGTGCSKWSGANATFADSYYDLNFKPNELPQVDQLQRLKQQAELNGAEIGVVTLGIGGNDAGFAEVIIDCILPLSCIPLFDSSIPGGGPPDGAVDIAGVVARVDASLDSIRSVVPAARIILVGYPVFIDAKLGNCPGKISRQEAEWIRGQILEMNRQLEDLVEFRSDPNIDFLSLDDAYRGHGLCNDSPGTQYVNGVIPRLVESDCIGKGLGGLGVCNESFHPNAQGHQATGVALANCLVNPTACGSASSDTVHPAALLVATQLTGNTPCKLIPVCVAAGKAVRVSGSGFVPGLPVKVMFFSDPVELAETVADTNGNVDIRVTVPADAQPGRHRLVLTGSGTTTITRTSVIDVLVGPPALTSVLPARVLETRVGEVTVDGQFEGVGRVAGGSVLELKVTGRGGVPVDADAVLLNVTAVRPDRNGYLTVFPCGSTTPLASNVNYRPGAAVPNAVLAKIGAGGKVCVFTNSTTDIVVDVNGYV